ncbi:hypothetical protein Gogos_008630 [Gossypium gossypioides]|uniref:Uncharacterized protein n=1 Tax=Gossypium gossypioides TaxID=34282 RepID=A0A7J9CC97_GOSGO|nr:hypothetical protein [Gossypium gossypioides]
MALSNQLCLVLVIFLSIFLLSSLPTTAIIPKANVSLPIPSSQLVENLCNGKAVQNRRFCLKTLSTPRSYCGNGYNPTRNPHYEIRSNKCQSNVECI